MTAQTRSGQDTDGPGPATRVPQPDDAASVGPHLLDQFPVVSTLRRQVTALLDGRGGVTVLRGPAGSGRSTILTETASLATQRGVTLLTAGADGGPAPEWTHGSGRCITARHPARTLQALLTAATTTAGHGPVLAVVDDADGYDQPAGFADQLAAIAESRPVLFLFAWRACPEDDRRLPGGRLLAPIPLSDTAVDMLVTARIGPDTPAAGLHSAIGGNPGLVLAALADLDDTGQPQWTGPALRHAVDRLLGPPDESGLLEFATALAVLDDITEPAILARILDLPTARLGDLADELTAADLIGSAGHLRSGAARAISTSTGSDVRHRLHTRAADVLHADGAPVREIVRHLLEIAEAPQPWAHDLLCETARQAAAEGSLTEAVRLLELALSWCPEPGRRMDLRMLLLDLRLRTGHPAGDLLDGLTAAARRPGSTDRWVALPRYLAWHDRPGDTLALLRQTAPGRDATPTIEHTISSLWVEHVFPGEQPRTAEQPLAPGPVPARYPWLRRTVELVRLFAAGDVPASVDAAVNVISRLQPYQDHAEPLQMALFTLMALEQSANCPSWTTEAMQKLQVECQPVWRSMFHATHAVHALWHGDVSTALDLADQALGEIDPQRTVLTAIPRSVRLLALTEQGRHGEVAAALCAPAPDILIRSPYGLLHLRARGRHHLAVGAVTSAMEDFQDIGRVMSSWDLENPGLLPWRLDLAEAVLALGDRAAARRLTEQHLSLPGGPASWSRAHALHLLSRSLPAQHRLPPLTEALDEIAGQGPTIVQIRTMIALAETHRSLGDLPASRDLYRQAERTARSVGTDLAYQALGHHTPTRPPHDGGADPLTPAERRVAELAARGYRNREISEALFITTSTVEQHLTRVFRKLDVERRDELGSRLDDAP